MFAFKTNHSVNTELVNYFMGKVQRLRLLVASVSLRWLGFNPKSFKGRSVVDRAAMAKGFLQLLQFSSVSVTSPMCTGLFHPTTTNAAHP
jgi:hypothetical protein